jgi:hypothetical protein
MVITQRFGLGRDTFARQLGPKWDFPRKMKTYLCPYISEASVCPWMIANGRSSLLENGDANGDRISYSTFMNNKVCFGLSRKSGTVFELCNYFSSQINLLRSELVSGKDPAFAATPILSSKRIQSANATFQDFPYSKHSVPTYAARNRVLPRRAVTILACSCDATPR